LWSPLSSSHFRVGVPIRVSAAITLFNPCANKEIIMRNEWLWYAVSALSVLAFIGVLYCAGAGYMTSFHFAFIAVLFGIAFVLIFIAEWRDGRDA